MRLDADVPVLADEPKREYERWLEARRGRLGGSDAAAACGMGRYGSRLKLWAYMTGKLPQEDLSQLERIHWGKIMEPVLLHEVRARIGAVVQPTSERLTVDAAQLVGRYKVEGRFAHQEVWRSFERPWQQATPDGFCRMPDRSEWGLVECKTTGGWLSASWGEEPPEEVILQVQHALAVLGLPYAVVPCLIGGNDFRAYLVERDDVMIAGINEVEAEFMGNVTSDTPPLADDHPDTLKTLKRLHPHDNGESVTLTDKAAGLARHLKGLKAERAKLDETMKGVEAEIRQEIGDNTFGVMPDGRGLVTLKTTYRQPYEVKATSWRTLRVKINKGAQSEV